MVTLPDRTQQQLALIGEFASLASSIGVECWLRGGWALDFLVGEVRREHEDIDFFVWASDIPKLLPVLEASGYGSESGPPSEQQRNFVKNGEELHVALLARRENGIVTAGGRWDDHPWPDGMLDGPVGSIGGTSCRVVSAEVQLYAKTHIPHALSHAPRERDKADIARLRQLLSGN